LSIPVQPVPFGALMQVPLEQVWQGGQLPQFSVPPHPLEIVPQAPAGQVVMGVQQAPPEQTCPERQQIPLQQAVPLAQQAPKGFVVVGGQGMVPPGQTHWPDTQFAPVGQHWAWAPFPHTGLVEGLQQNFLVLLLVVVKAQIRPSQHCSAAQLLP
jgi:hypothetical protein